MAGKKRTSKPRKKAAARKRPPDTPEPTLPAVNEAVTPHDTPEDSLPFSIVCVGASAGGLEATVALLRSVPADIDMAFVVVQHLAPDHASFLPEILGRSTAMPVVQARQAMPIESGRVYVIPPDKFMAVAGGTVRLSPRKLPRGEQRSIDHFMRSLAEEYGYKAIGVVLSGSGTDGTQGLEEIKAAGGITFAQDSTAEHPSMPRSAISAGCVDFVLPPEEIGRELGRISRHPFVGPAADLVPTAGRADPAVTRVLDALRQVTGVDFANYKRNTLHRRITRRMVLHKLDGMADYVRMLQSQPAEVQALYQDILINVTSFFRNPEAYEALKKQVFPRLTADRTRHDPVRVWALGCSTGEEAYSTAMAFTEYLEDSGRRVPIQIFATDLNGGGIDRARTGVYAKGVAQDVSPERLRRFFIEVDGRYRVTKQIREMCVFARHNVLSDPPFSRIDLVACRNLLIYLEPVLQQRLMPILHYALRPSGFLWLGNSETIGSFRDLFELEDARNKVYSRKPGFNRGTQVPVAVRGAQAVGTVRYERPPEPVTGAVDPQKEADRMLLARYAPPGVVIDSEFDIIQFRGDTSPYLTPAPGRATLNLMKMLREGLLVAVRGAVHRARREDIAVREAGLRFSSGDSVRDVDVLVLPMKGANLPHGSLLVLFEEAANVARAQSRSSEAKPRPTSAAPADESEQRAIARLQQELGSTREYLQSVIEQQEAANEELQSANEEVQSANEELQSINEELETSKEEIQSSNEELATVNDELQNRNIELSQSNNDLTNLLSSVNMAIVMLGRDLRIRRFTPAAEKMFNLIPADVGRPIGDIKLRLEVPDFESLLADAIDSVSVREIEVQDQSGRWFILRVRPYKTLENKIDGCVLVLVDVDSIKRAEQSLRESDRSKNEFLALLAHELRNPLAALQSAVDLWSAGADERTLTQARTMAMRQLHSMTSMVDDLLDVARISHGTIHLEFEPVDLASIVNAAIAATEHFRKNARQHLNLSLPPPPVLLQGDATRLEQVLGNLLSNASKFTHDGGDIWLSLAVDPALDGSGREAVIRVRDNGTGIDAVSLPRIFELFVQFDRSHDRRHGGLGIGLALARKLVELHGGRIEAHSRGRGQGSEFILRLPLGDEAGRDEPDPARKAMPAPSRPAVSRRAGPLTVLVVDDNVDAAGALRALLELEGHKVEVAYDGPTALELARSLAPQLILLDLVLPGMDGYKVAGRLRALDATRGAYIVALSGLGAQGDIVACRDAGFDEHVPKPIDHGRLQRLLARMAPPAVPVAEV